MPTLELPINPVPIELIDPMYEARHELLLTAPSARPIIIGRLADQQRFSEMLPNNRGVYTWRNLRGQSGLNVEFAEDGTVSYTFPETISQFAEAISIIASHEHGAYPQASYSEIEIDPRQTAIEKGEVQAGFRKGHKDYGLFHRDGMRGEWKHIYVVSDLCPTEFLRIRKAMAEKSYDPKLPRRLIRPKPYQVAYANSKSYHRSPEVDHAGVRTFLRVTYVHELDESRFD